jgi:HK97 family phage major capsid protein
VSKEKLKELRGKIDERREKLHKVFEEAGSEMDMSKVESIGGDSPAKVEAIRTLDEEINDLAKEIEPLEAEEATLNRARRQAEEHAEQLQGHPLPPRAGGAEGREAVKSIGQVFVESGAGHAEKGDLVVVEDLDLRATLFETGGGWEPEVVRTGRLVEKAVRPIQVIDIIPGGSTSQSSVKYIEETVFTNAAKEIAEGGKFPEAALKLKEAESPVRKIAVFLPVTDEQLEDVPQAQAYVNNRLPFMLRQRLDGQVVGGDGEAPNLEGFLEKEGVQVQAKGADPIPDAIYKAMTKVRVTGRAVPGPVIMHPNDWQQVRLLRTADGIYIWGSPSEAGPERIWGQQVVQADVITEGTALTGDFANFSELPLRRGIELKVSDSHAEFFTEGKQAIRADLRAALVIYRPEAFCEITEI